MCFSPHSAVASVEKIARLGRRKVYLDDEERFVFPSPVQIAEQGQRPLADLRLGLSSRPRNIFLMAISLTRDPLLVELRETPRLSTGEAVRLLDSYRGIGAKIAGCVALMCLDKLDAFPVDRWVQRALAHCDVKGGGKAYRCGGARVAHWHDEKDPNGELGGVRSGAGVPSSGVSQESSGSSEIGEAAFPRLCRRR